MSDFYKVLGVSKDSNQEEIKKAYRKLSLKHHPDKNGGNDTKFKNISEAYETLGDEGKRQMYNMQQNNPFANMGGMGGMGDMRGGGADEFLNMLFGGMGGMGGMGGINFANMGPNVRIFRNGVQVNAKPEPLIKKIIITLQDSFNGTKVPIEIERNIRTNNVNTKEVERVYIDIPMGIDDNEMIILRGKGNIINDSRGDVKIHVTIKNNTEFVRKGLDLYYTKTISLKDALIGFTFDLHHISGKKYTINNNGTVITGDYKKMVRNMGMKRERPHPASPMVGNLIISFKIDFPKELTKEQREAIEKVF